MLNEQQQQNIHIFAILGTHKHCFKVRCNASSYTRVFRSVLIKDHAHPFFEKHEILASERRLSLQMYSRLCETMKQLRNSCLIVYKDFPRFPQDLPVFVDKRRYNGGSCLHVQAHNRFFPSGLYNRSWFPPRIGGLSACMGNVVHSTYTTGKALEPVV